VLGCHSSDFHSLITSKIKFFVVFLRDVYRQPEKKYNNKKKEGWGSANTDDGKFGPRSHLYQPKAWPPSGPVQRTIKLSDHMRHQNCTNWFASESSAYSGFMRIRWKWIQLPKQEGNFDVGVLHCRGSNEDSNLLQSFFHWGKLFKKSQAHELEPMESCGLFYFEKTMLSLSISHCGAAYCSVVQCGVVWCSVAQCGAVCCSVKWTYPHFIHCAAVWNVHIYISIYIYVYIHIYFCIVCLCVCVCACTSWVSVASHLYHEGYWLLTNDSM